MIRRNTIQKEMVLQTVRALHSHVSADEVYDAIVQHHPTVSKGTVYRNLTLLSEEGQIRRVGIPNGPDRFDFTLEEHYHMVCSCCNRVEDIDLSSMPELLKSVEDSHGYLLMGFDILFQGICPACQDGKEKIV